MVEENTAMMFNKDWTLKYKDRASRWRMRTRTAPIMTGNWPTSYNL